MASGRRGRRPGWVLMAEDPPHGGGMVRGPTWAECQGSGGRAAWSKGLAGSEVLVTWPGLTSTSAEREGARARLFCARPTSGAWERERPSLGDC